MNKFYEEFKISANIRQSQYEQLSEYILSLLKSSCELCEDKFKPDFSNTENFIEYTASLRNKLAVAIGYPPVDCMSSTEAREECIGEDDLCTIYRMYVKVDSGLDCYGLYMIPKIKEKKSPLVLVFHGGGGCPEMIYSFQNPNNYNEASKKFLEKGAIVFCPMFCFKSYADEDNSSIPESIRTIIDTRAKWIGTSLAAIELFKVRRTLDYLLSKDEIDNDRVGVAGLSYGGFYSLLLASLDLRIKFCISSCYFNDRILINERHPNNFIDWTWKGSINEFSDIHLIALICPRSCYIEVGINDDLFPIEGARMTIAKVKRIYEQLGIQDRLKYFEFEGGHEFNLEFLDEVIYNV